MILQALLFPLAFASSADTTPCTGAYVEARTASVFAGACHYNGEFVTAGRAALCAWRIEDGAYAGVDLSGVSIAAIVASERNLDANSADAHGADERAAAHGTPISPRRSVLVYDARLEPERAAAAVRWLAATRADLVGTVVEVLPAPLDVVITADAYDVHAPGIARLAGHVMPDRACCSMPQNVWYAPLEAIGGALVGLDETFEVNAPSLGRAWSRPHENAAFTGRFGVR